MFTLAPDSGSVASTGTGFSSTRLRTAAKSALRSGKAVAQGGVLGEVRPLGELVPAGAHLGHGKEIVQKSLDTRRGIFGTVERARAAGAAGVDEEDVVPAAERLQMILKVTRVLKSRLAGAA